MTESFIGPKQTSLYELRELGYALGPGITAVSVRITKDGKSIEGQQWRSFRETINGIEKSVFKSEEISGETKKIIEGYIKSSEFVTWHKSEFSVSPGVDFEFIPSKELMATVKASPQWPDIEAAVAVDGISFREAAKANGIHIYREVTAKPKAVVAKIKK